MLCSPSEIQALKVSPIVSGQQDPPTGGHGSFGMRRVRAVDHAGAGGLNVANATIVNGRWGEKRALTGLRRRRRRDRQPCHPPHVERQQQRLNQPRQTSHLRRERLDTPVSSFRSDPAMPCLPGDRSCAVPGCGDLVFAERAHVEVCDRHPVG